MTPSGTVKSASRLKLEAPSPATGRATVSVVMCVYAGDRPGPLRDAVRSVLDQTFSDLVLRIYVDGPVETNVRAEHGQEPGHIGGVADRVRLVEPTGAHKPFEKQKVMLSASATNSLTGVLK